jgi:catechol 2,3-dioxygenase-like lactoylglutathione lyase family enzyme
LGPGSIRDIHHVQICIAPGADAEARRFYCELLGLPEVEKPEALKARGGFWLQVGSRQIHINGEEGPRSKRAHVAYEVDSLERWRARLAAAGVTAKDGEDIPGYRRFELRDPFGNRIEFLERI